MCEFLLGFLVLPKRAADPLSFWRVERKIFPALNHSSVSPHFSALSYISQRRQLPYPQLPHTLLSADHTSSPSPLLNLYGLIIEPHVTCTGIYLHLEIATFQRRKLNSETGIQSIVSDITLFFPLQSHKLQDHFS